MIIYTFHFKGEKPFRFEVDEKGNTSIENTDHSPAEWLKLENNKCDSCNLNKADRKTCPAALFIQPILNAFAGRTSFETIKVIVEINNTVVHATMPAQNAIRSLMGLCLALSACPVLKKLRPMATFHVPFGGIDNAIYRFFGMYLTGEYLRVKNGHSSKGDLSGFKSFMNRLHEVNLKLSNRIALITDKDATGNSLVILDTLTSILKMEIDSSLKKLKPHFGAYLE